MYRTGRDSLALRSADLGVTCVCCNGCAPLKGSNGEQGPDGNKSAKAFFTLTSAFAKATADRPSLSRSTHPSRERGL